MAPDFIKTVADEPQSTVVGPGRSEILLEARKRLEERRQKLLDKQAERAAFVKKQKAEANRDMALKLFCRRYFQIDSSEELDALTKDEETALAEMLTRRAKRYVSTSLLVLPLTLGTIIYASTISVYWIWALVPWVFYFLGRMFSDYNTNDNASISADYHLKFLRANRLLSKLSRLEKPVGPTDAEFTEARS